MEFKTAIGQDSHRFDYGEQIKKLILGGIVIEKHHPLSGNSDADVVLHALTNAISGITCVNILGEIADRMCFDEDIRHSGAYVLEAMKHLGSHRVTHVSFAIECSNPKITPYIPAMRKNIAGLLEISEDSIGITATTGEGMTPFGKGEGINVICILTAAR